jgi:hypothetical protein
VSDALRDADATTLRRRAAAPPGTRVGVVRSPPPWFDGVVAENCPELGLPAALRAAFRERRETFAVRGLCATGAAEAAFDAVDVADRYRDHLAAGDAAAAVDALVDRLRDGEALTLVSAEAVSAGPSHRTVLRERLAARTD